MINQVLARQGQNVCRIFQAETHSKAHEKKHLGTLNASFMYSAPMRFPGTKNLEQLELWRF